MLNFLYQMNLAVNLVRDSIMLKCYNNTNRNIPFKSPPSINPPPLHSHFIYLCIIYLFIVAFWGAYLCALLDRGSGGFCSNFRNVT